MQDIDFYTRKNVRRSPYHLESQDPEYFNHLSDTAGREDDRMRNKANRMMSLIIALCIISFTTGLILGIKLTSDSQSSIVDDKTKNAMNILSKKVTTLIKESGEAPSEQSIPADKKLFPKDEFPYVIKIGADFDKSKSHEIASFLSKRGHTVILSKKNQNYRIYTGPFKNTREAEAAVNKIREYSTQSWSGNTTILKR